MVAKASFRSSRSKVGSRSHLATVLIAPSTADGVPKRACRVTQSKLTEYFKILQGT